MDAAGNLTGGEKSGNGFAISAEDSGLRVDLEATHGVVEDRGHESNVEDVIHLPLSGLEELFAEWALLSPHDVVVLLEGLLELGRADAHILGKCNTVLVPLHEATADVVFAVPLNLLGGFTVEDQPDWVLYTKWSVGTGGNTRIQDKPCPSVPKSFQ